MASFSFTIASGLAPWMSYISTLPSDSTLYTADSFVCGRFDVNLSVTFFSFSLRRFALAAAMCATLSGVALADSITGTVINKTTNKPAAGDDVVLIRLAQGMQESTRAKTDKKGHFSLDVPDTDSMHLVRVTHDKANYFQPVPPGTTNLDFEVFTAAAKVEGVT